MQLMAVAAARCQSSVASADRAPGFARASELPTMLDAMKKCIEAAKLVVEVKRSETAAGNGERSLEEKILNLEEHLAEEARARLVQEEALANAERTLQETKAAVRSATAECERVQSETATGAPDEEQLDLEKQLEELRQMAASPAELADAGVVKLLGEQLLGLQKQVEQGASEISKLEAKRHELKQAVQDTVSVTRRVEAQVQRERELRETEQELMGQSPEEQLLILQTHEAKLKSQSEKAEMQIAQMQGETAAHKEGNRKLEAEKAELASKAEDTNLQMQIVQEERDSLREAMEQLWIEKATVDDDLQNQEASYVHLSERLNSHEDEIVDLQMQVEKKKDEVHALQRNGFAAMGTAM